MSSLLLNSTLEAVFRPFPKIQDRPRAVNMEIDCRHCLLAEIVSQKCASDHRPPHTRQNYGQKAGQNMTPNASKQGNLDSFGAIFLFIFLPCMWGLGFQNDSPVSETSILRSSLKENFLVKVSLYICSPYLHKCQTQSS